MKKNLTSLEINYLVREFKQLISSKIDKIYNYNKTEFYFQLHIPSVGKKILKIEKGKFMFLTSKKRSSPQPSTFCMSLRKNLENSRLRHVSQISSERIVEFIFENKEGKLKLIIELFSKGNIVVCDEKNKIMLALERQTWKDRTIAKGESYKYPKKDVNFLGLDKKQLRNTLKRSEKDSIVKALAIDIGLGGSYSEEACLLSNITKSEDPNAIKNLDKLLDTISKIKNKKINPVAVFKDDKLLDITPFKLKTYEEQISKEYSSYNEALDKNIIIESRSKESIAKEKELKKINTIIEQQEKKIKQMESAEERSRTKGELLYNNYQLTNDILSNIEKASQKLSLSDIKEKLKGHKIIKDFNTKNKTIAIELK